MSATRVIESEWLDTLAADDPRALRSRRDLRRVNAWMLQAGIMAQALLRYPFAREPATIIELGAGDGTFMLRVAKRLAARWRNVRVVLVDQQNLLHPATARQFSALGWTVEAAKADVFAFLKSAAPASADIVSANLFLHHFAPDALGVLLQGAARLAPFFVACEPRRGSLPLAASRCLWAIGCNDVSRHDAVASVRAGFAGDELSRLWPSDGAWNLEEKGKGLFTHCFVARRNASEPQ